MPQRPRIISWCVHSAPFLGVADHHGLQHFLNTLKPPSEADSAEWQSAAAPSVRSSRSSFSQLTHIANRFRPRTTTLRPSPLRPSDPAGFHPTLAMVASPACYGKPDPTASFNGTASHKRKRRIRKGRSFSVSHDAMPVRFLNPPFSTRVLVVLGRRVSQSAVHDRQRPQPQPAFTAGFHSSPRSSNVMAEQQVEHWPGPLLFFFLLYASLSRAPPAP